MQKLTQNQITSLESLRGISAMLVVIAHTFQFFIARYYPELSRANGLVAQSSVMVFFVMSGFLIGKSTQNNIQKNGGVFSLSQYAKSRFNRIYPPLIFSILLVLFLSFLAPFIFESGTDRFASTDSWINGRGVFYWPSQMFGVLTFTTGILPQGTPFNTPLWSLPFEVWYYVVAALLFTKNKFYAIIAAILFFSISSANNQLFILSVVWFSGMLLSFVKINSKVHRIISSIFLSIFCLFAYHYGDKYIHHGGEYFTYSMMFGLSFTSFLYLSLLCFDVKFNFYPSASGFSYTLYIIHYPLLMVIIGMFESKITSGINYALPLAIVGFVSSLLIAKLVARYVENPKFIERIME